MSENGFDRRDMDADCMYLRSTGSTVLVISTRRKQNAQQRRKNIVIRAHGVSMVTFTVIREMI